MAQAIIEHALILQFGGEIKSYNENDLIFQEGQVCHYYYQVVKGKVRWCNVNEDGREFLQNLIDPGESFGEIPLFDHEPYVSSAIANQECEIYRLSKEKFHEILRLYPEIHFRFTTLLAQRLRYKFRIIKEIPYKSPEDIVVNLLNYLVEHDKNICPECNMIQLTRQQIADMTGLRVETVIRVIKALEKNQQVTIIKGKVHYSGDMSMVIKSGCRY